MHPSAKLSRRKGGVKEEARGILFHWVANMFFAGVALFGGIAFGLEVPKGTVVPIIVVGALALIPVTRRWERSGIERRKVQAGEVQGKDFPEESG